MTITLRVAWTAAAILVLGAASQAQNPFEPTDEHKMLAGDVGVWDAEIKTWPTGPDSEPTVEKGTETVKALGDLWTISDFAGQFSGMEFAGHGVNGYDPIKKKFVGTWVDTMSLTPMILEGTYDAPKKTLTLTSEGVNPATKEAYKLKETVTWKDKDHRNFVMYMTMPGAGDELVKMMEINYSRKK